MRVLGDEGWVDNGEIERGREREGEKGRESIEGEVWSILIQSR